MPTNEEIQESLKPIFRAQEIERREHRRQILLNHLKLDAENLTPAEVKIHKEVVGAVKGNYWRRLWNAIRGR